MFAVTGAAAGCSHQSGAAKKSSPTIAARDVKTLPAQRVTELTASLAAGKPAALRSAVAIPAGQTLDPAAAAGLAALGPIAFDAGTYRQTDATHATVAGTLAHPADPADSDWTFDLVWVDQHWMLSDAKPRP